MRLNELEVAQDKTKIIMMGKNRNAMKMSLEFDQYTIFPVTEMDCLGVTIDRGMSLSKHISTVCLKAMKTVKTTSRLAAMVIAVLVPIHLICSERKTLFSKLKIVTEVDRKIEREWTLNRWQRE